MSAPAKKVRAVAADDDGLDAVVRQRFLDAGLQALADAALSAFTGGLLR
jgi:hypothetical protein